MSSPNTWNAAPPTYDAHSSTQLRPYLQLPHLISLTWLAYPILSLIFVVFRLQLSLASSQDAVAGAKDDLLTSCKAAEKAATAAASMPRYMAIATNEQVTKAVNDSMNAAREALTLALTIMETVINFIVDIYRSTFLCFLELVIRGGLAILIGAVQELNVVVQAAASGIRTAIQDTVSGANTVLQGLSKAASILHITIPTISVPDLSALENVTLPQSFTDSITALNNSLPTFDELKQTVEKFIDTPFELLKADINDTFSGLSFNSSVLAVPDQNTLSFCTDLDTSVIDDLGRDLVKVAKIGTLIIILLILVLIGLNCLLEWYKWRCQRRHLEYTRQAWSTDPTLFHKSTSGGNPNVTLTDHNLLMLQANGAHPLLTRIANTLSAKLRLSPSKHIHLQWFLHYIFHPPALACFLLGFFGLLSVELQLLAIHPLVDKYSAQAASTATDFSNTIATSINASMFNQSAVYASSVNAHVDTIQSTINDGLFGWVNSTTTTLNTTIENFYEDIQNAVNVVFNGTILDAPIQEFIKCIIGSKVDAIENALTFLHDNLHIDMPRVNESILVLSPQSVNEATQPIAAAAIGDQNGDGGLIGKLVNTYAASLRKERLMFGIFMALWGFVVLMGVAIILWHSYGRAFVEKRSRRKFEREQRSLPMAEEKGFGSGDLSVANNLHSDLPSFTPLPSPKLGGSFNPFAFARSISPKLKNNEASGSTDSLSKSNNRSWDSFFEKPRSGRSNIKTREISKPMKLVGFGRRGREVFVGNRDSPAAPPSAAEQFEDQPERRTTKWFGRFAGLIGKTSPAPTIEPYPEFSVNRNSSAPSTRVRPTLRVTIASDPPIDAGLDASVAQQQHDRSRWSVSPENTARAPPRPWTGLMSPTAGGRRHKHKPSVPSNVNSMDVNSIYDVSMAGIPSMQPTPLAMPLHAGFDVARKQPILPHHPAVVNAAQASHRRSISVPDAAAYNYASAPPPRLTVRNAPPSANDPFADVNRLAPPTSEASPSTPVTRLLTTTHARRSSSVDPFVTPFDDEHRVTIAHAVARKSVQTNPFAGVAV
ncbi:hypothetical protein C8F04DRAFT_1037318 [Mycena alexandri]|uniref:Plasma membrane fusion protein PRM1 n=1 Tax=Mycena alexandri TaxID=1745969 RepID=A0AAD6SYX9_9AGAR|nr:hypothetical protein C8F04DRAFT_1037318 [Mycena alexandri]